MVDPVARFIFPIDPFLFAVEVCGLGGVVRIITTWHWAKIPEGIKQYLKESYFAGQHDSVVHISEARQSTTEWMIACFIITAIAIGLVSLGTMKPIINFEYWSTGELSLPTGWAYAQSGTGGWIRKVTEEDNVRIGTSSVGIEGSSIGNTQLYYMIDRNKERQMRGKVIELAG